MTDDRQLKIEMAEAMAAKLKRRYEANPFLVIREGLLKIKTKAGEYKRFTLNPIQDKLLSQIEILWSKKKPIRIWVLKARQEGASTLLEAVVYVLTAFHKNTNSFIISDDIDGSNYLFEMSKLYHTELKRLDSCLVPDTKRSNAKELVFESTRSQILIDTARNAAAGRKYTFQIVHLSEIAYYDHADKLMTGLLQAVPDLPGTIVIGETTANGVGGYFYTEWKRAERNESGWIPLFFPWFDNPEYSKEFESEEEGIALRNSLDDEEKNLIDNFGVSYRQLNWRRMCIKDKCGACIETFYQEYPSWPDQSFLVSGRPRFDTHKVKNIYECALTQQYRQGYLALPNERELMTTPGATKDSVLFHPDPNGEWKVWEMPDHRAEYVIFADTAGGEEIEGIAEGKKGDYNVIEIFRRPHVNNDHRPDSLPTCDTLVQVAEYRSRIDPDLLADEVYLAWLAYGRSPAVGLEVNNHGRTTADHLKARCPVYRREVLDETTRKVTKKLGWYTDKNTKKLMIDDLAEAIREGWIVIKSTALASECQTYVRSSDGSTNAQEGCFDDTVMATAGAVQMHLRTPRKSAFKVVEMRNTALSGRI